MGVVLILPVNQRPLAANQNIPNPVELCDRFRRILLDDLKACFKKWFDSFNLKNTLRLSMENGTVIVTTASAEVKKWFAMCYIETGCLIELWQRVYPPLKSVKVCKRQKPAGTVCQKATTRKTGR